MKTTSFEQHKVIDQIKLGSIVTLPSGLKGQVKEIRFRWVHKYVGSRFIKEREDVLVSPHGGRGNFWVAAYMIDDVEGMPECGG